jgi:uncharacterized membrane protein
MVVFGTEHFIYPEFVASIVPRWMPGELFWTYFCGLALIAAGAGILIRKQATLAATLLGSMIFIWVVVLHIPRSIELDKISEWTNTFNALTMSSGAFLLAGLFRKDVSPTGSKERRRHEINAAF